MKRVFQVLALTLLAFPKCSFSQTSTNALVVLSATTSAQVNLEVTNAIGEYVAQLVHERQQPGTHSAVFDGGHLPSGAYFYRLTATTEEGIQFTDVKKITLVK